MVDFPLRQLSVFDFRRLEGHRVLPLDAPIVLLHGPNGSGKTSVLSALEIALTGEIRSMHRVDNRYLSHLPFQGHDYATLHVTISDSVAASLQSITMTVGGDHIDGAPALRPDAIQFFTERCYLDQTSLGRLLEFYQYREEKRESALAHFVNELLGLEQLDALRAGLHPATHLARLKTLCPALAEADSEAHRLETELSQVAIRLDAARDLLGSARTALTEAIVTMGYTIPQGPDEGFDQRVVDVLRLAAPAADDMILEFSRAVATLGGRIESLAHRPSVLKLERARAAREEADVALDQWNYEHHEGISAWRESAGKLGLDLADGESDALTHELERATRRMADQDQRAERAALLDRERSRRQEQLTVVQNALSEARELTGSLVEGLAALREHATTNVCPVCDRNFNEVSKTHLTFHIDTKIDELVSQGQQLRELSQRRDELARQVQGHQEALDAARAELWSESQWAAARSRASAIAELREQFRTVGPAIDAGREMERRRDLAVQALDELDAAERDVGVVTSEVRELSRALDVPTPPSGSNLEAAWRQLADVVSEREQRHAADRDAHRRATDLLRRYREHAANLTDITAAIANVAEEKARWDGRVGEAKRRQTIAKAVLDASSAARTSIVQRVFTKSLNDVWAGVFTRLAPREPFVPAFGIPRSSRTILELELRTVHSSGELGGAPQVMLSAGNLNTAALSLFLALHLAVEPVVPCLVFDDPVQSMDEVHVAQLASLIRVLAKYHHRQIIIAVHERKLFQYLSLELSPAFEGDELITIELGALSGGESDVITRHTWHSDEAIAG